MEQSSDSLSRQTGFEQEGCSEHEPNSKVMTQDCPEIFSGTVKGDETSVGGQWSSSVLPAIGAVMN